MARGPTGVKHPRDPGKDQALARWTEFFILNVPLIMHNKGWEIGEAFQWKWFTSPGRQSGGRDALDVDTTTVKMDWILQFPYARKVYDRIFTDKIYQTEPARRVLKKKLEEMTWSGRPVNDFGDFTRTGEDLHRQQINYILSDTTELDDLGASLARFHFYVIGSGEAANTLDGFAVTMSRVGVYARDVFEFNDSQMLGYWALPDQVSKEPFFGCTPVGNDDYRAYRDKTKMGGDFDIFSDVKVTPLNPPEKFLLR
jgi:hypothetical protein